MRLAERTEMGENVFGRKNVPLRAVRSSRKLMRTENRIQIVEGVSRFVFHA